MSSDKVTGEKRIANGSKVKWVSSGTEKTGAVLVFIPRCTTIGPEWMTRIEEGAGEVMKYSYYDRYLVEVPRKGKRGPLKSAYYSPHAGVVERANPKAKRS